MIKYDKLWKTMEDRGISQNMLFKQGFSHGQMDRIRKGEYVSTHTIDLLCNLLGCEIEDIITHIPDKVNLNRE